MSKERRGVRDGTGPRKGSFQQKKHGVGRRRQAGLKCPLKKSK